MTKATILAEISRTADANGRVPLGVSAFFQETGIRQGDWEGRYWVRWSDAVREAGFEPNKLQSSYDEPFLFEHLIKFIREIGHFPVKAEFQMRKRSFPDFPSWITYTRLATKTGLRTRAAMAERLMEYCRLHIGSDDVIALCEPILKNGTLSADPDEHGNEPEIGFVYLLKSGRFYKIGRSNSSGRRERELAIQLPEKALTVHTITTDDPVGIEAYWHNRFTAKRKNGEWFDLSSADLQAFRRRKFM